jgi:hypothetical protein
MAKIDKLSGLFKLDPDEEKENEERLAQAEGMLKGIELIEKAGIDFGALKSQLKGTIKLGQTIRDFNNTTKLPGK